MQAGSFAKIAYQAIFYARPPQTVMLTCSLYFATSKILIYFQKRFDGISQFSAIRVESFNSGKFELYNGF